MNDAEKLVVAAALGGLIGAGVIFLATRPAPVAAIAPKPAAQGLSFPFLENLDRVDPNAPTLI